MADREVRAPGATRLPARKLNTVVATLPRFAPEDDDPVEVIVAMAIAAPTQLWNGQMEGMTGIEPALSAWEAEVLPLNYIPESGKPQHPTA